MFSNKWINHSFIHYFNDTEKIKPVDSLFIVKCSIWHLLLPLKNKLERISGCPKKALSYFGINTILSVTWCCVWWSPGFPDGWDSKESACNAETQVRSLGWEDSPGEGNGYSLQHSCLENSMDRGTWQAIVHGVARSQTGLRDWHVHIHFDGVHYFFLGSLIMCQALFSALPC